MNEKLANLCAACTFFHLCPPGHVLPRKGLPDTSHVDSISRMFTWVGISLRWPNSIYGGTANKIQYYLSWFRMKNLNEKLQNEWSDIRYCAIPEMMWSPACCSPPVPRCYSSSDALIEIYCKDIADRDLRRKILSRLVFTMFYKPEVIAFSNHENEKNNG